MKFSTYLIFPLLLCLFSCKVRFKPSHARDNFSQVYKVKDSVGEDSLTPIQSFLTPFRDSLAKQMNEVIGEAMAEFEKKKPNSSLGNLVVDAMYLKAMSYDSTVFGAITNYGGIRIPEIKKGPITVGKIYEMLPFDNELVIVEVKGSDLEKWMNLIAESGGWPVQFGMPLHFKQNKFVRVWDELETDVSTPFQSITQKSNYQIEDNTIYKIATNDYVANGGDNCEFLKECKRISTSFTIRDMMLDQVKQSKKLIPNCLLHSVNSTFDPQHTDIENRIQFIK